MKKPLTKLFWAGGGSGRFQELELSVTSSSSMAACGPARQASMHINASLPRMICVRSHVALVKMSASALAPWPFCPG